MTTAEESVRTGFLARLPQFGAVGLSGMVVDLGTYSALLTVMPLPVSRAAAIFVAMTWNFYLNRHITFSDARRDSPWRQYVLYCASCSLGALISWTISVGLVSSSGYFEAHSRVAAMIGIAAGTLSNYLFSYVIVFRADAAPECPPVATNGPQ